MSNTLQITARLVRVADDLHVKAGDRLIVVGDIVTGVYTGNHDAARAALVTREAKEMKAELVKSQTMRQPTADEVKELTDRIVTLLQSKPEVPGKELHFEGVERHRVLYIVSKLRNQSLVYSQGNGAHIVYRWTGKKE